MRSHLPETRKTGRLPMQERLHIGSQQKVMYKSFQSDAKQRDAGCDFFFESYKKYAEELWRYGSKVGVSKWRQKQNMAQ